MGATRHGGILLGNYENNVMVVRMEKGRLKKRWVMNELLLLLHYRTSFIHVALIFYFIHAYAFNKDDINPSPFD